MNTQVRENKVGTVVDQRYRLDEVIGHGAMGQVYRGTQIAVGRPVAIKVLRTDVEIEPRYQRRFENEARAVARLSHPGIVTLYDFGYSFDQNLFYMAFEYLKGESLEDLISRDKLPFGVVAQICRQIAIALNHAHRANVTHRDLKPSNVMLVDEDGETRVKILDFGLALAHGSTDELAAEEGDEETGEEDRRLSQDGEVRGTPAYMSPEQCRGQLDIDSSTDVYALGCLMFEVLEGQLPYDHDDIFATLEAHTGKPIPKVRSPEVPAKVRKLVYQMLSKERESRPDMRHVIDVLSRYPGADGSDEADSRSQPADPSGWVRPFLTAFVVTVVIILIAGYAFT
jgi:serine/threonine-protein kinase